MKQITWLSLVIFTLAMVSCFQSPVSIKVEPQKIELFDPGASATLKPSALDKKGKAIEKAKFEFSSDNVSVAVVDDTGKVTAQSSGTATIQIKVKEVTQNVPVTVVIADILKMEFPVPGIYDVMGPDRSTHQLNLTAKNESGKDLDLSFVKFKSSDEKVATVNGKGELTILGDGKTVISAQLGKKKASLEVPVTILKPSAIKVDSQNFSINAGDATYLPFTVISTKGTNLIDFPVKVEFEKEGIATADGIGKVTGVAKGTTKVTVSAGDAKNTLNLTVK